MYGLIEMPSALLLESLKKPSWLFHAKMDAEFRERRECR